MIDAVLNHGDAAMVEHELTAKVGFFLAIVGNESTLQTQLRELGFERRQLILMPWLQHGIPPRDPMPSL